MNNPLLDNVLAKAEQLDYIVDELNKGMHMEYSLGWDGRVSTSRSTHKEWEERKKYKDPLSPNHSPSLDKDLVHLDLFGSMTLDELKELIAQKCIEKQKEKRIEGLEFTSVEIEHELLFYQHIDNGVFDVRTAVGWSDGDTKTRDIISEIRQLDFDKWTTIKLQMVPNDGTWNTNRCINKFMSDDAMDETIRELKYAYHLDKYRIDRHSNSDSSLRVVGIYTERK